MRRGSWRRAARLAALHAGVLSEGRNLPTDPGPALACRRTHVLGPFSEAPRARLVVAVGRGPGATRVLRVMNPEPAGATPCSTVRASPVDAPRRARRE